MADVNEVITDAESFEGDVPAILPDGWQEGDDLFAEDTPEDLAGPEADGLSDADFLERLLTEDGDDSGALTTGGANGGSAGDADARGSTAQPDGAGAATPSASRKLTLKVNHQEQVVDVAGMSDEDLTALLQKGYAFDAMKDAEDRREFLRVYEEQLDAGMTEATARLVARDLVGKPYAVKDGKVYAPGEGEDAPRSYESAPDPLATAPTLGSGKRDLRAEVEAFRQRFPDVREIPDEVATAISRGASVVDAYNDYRIGQLLKAADSVRKENKTLRQNAANAQRALVRGASRQSTGNQKSDPLLAGFDEGWIWD